MSLACSSVRECPSIGLAGQSSAGRWREAAGSTPQVDDPFECGRNSALLTFAFGH
jgi:hypothetical protein